MRLYRGKWLRIAGFLCCASVFAADKQAQDPVQLKKLPPGQAILWQDPGNVESADLVYGIGGEAKQPRPPFQFVEEDMSGTNPKVKVKDASGANWSVKWGPESRSSVFCTRLVWACGYTVETEYFVQRGQIIGAHGLTRAASYVRGDGSFGEGRFQLRSDNPKFLSDHNWAWTNNPFVGTPWLNGLKVLVMLLSNWDTKDARDMTNSGQTGTADSNLAIFADPAAAEPRYLFFVSDWGASLGRWGSSPGGRTKWDCKGYAAETPGFVKDVDHGNVKWGYGGKHNSSIVNGIRISDVEWLMHYLGRLSDDQLRRGLASSGASPDEMECYLTSIRNRITALQAIH